MNGLRDNLAPEWISRQHGPWLQLAEPRDIEWNRVRLPIPGLPQALVGLRILHVSDFHLRKHWYPSLDGLLKKIEQSRPDLIAATGDFGQNKHDYRPSLPHVLRLVDGLRARLGTFGIIGNHDQPGVIPHLQTTHMHVMEHRRETISVGDAKIEIIGLPGHHRDDLDPKFASSLPAREPGTLRIVLSHHPDHIRRTASLKPDLFLAGHTHGGQVCLPGGWPPICHDALPRCMSKGIHRVDDTWLVVNRGVGFSGPAIRMFCPSEVIEMEIAVED